MPKLKTKSSAKKRFKISARGKVIMPQAGKRHGMIKRTNSQIRKQRGTTVMSKQDGKIVNLCSMHIEIGEIRKEISNHYGYKELMLELD